MESTLMTSPRLERSRTSDLQSLFDDPALPAESRFLHWLTRLPLSADVAEAARLALGALDRVPEPTAETRRLRAFLTQATAALPVMPRRRNRSRH